MKASRPQRPDGVEAASTACGLPGPERVMEFIRRGESSPSFVVVAGEDPDAVAEVPARGRGKNL
ncbi:hypothetical protein ABZ769_03145 [Streptomyces olivoreticuli]